jgi:hypothetical protein
MDVKKQILIHFNSDFSYPEIMEYVKDKKDIEFFTWTLKEGKEFHIVKINNENKIKLNIFECELLKHYGKIPEMKKIVSTMKVKGNDSFAIIENTTPNFLLKMKSDLNILLNKLEK